MTEKPKGAMDKSSTYLLHGWDDEKIYLFSDETGERCVSDEPELLRRLTQMCVEYFEKHPTGGTG